MDTIQVNESAKGSNISPIINVRFPERHQQLITDAANLKTNGNKSAFIREAAIAYAESLLKQASSLPTLAS